MSYSQSKNQLCNFRYFKIVFVLLCFFIVLTFAFEVIYKGNSIAEIIGRCLGHSFVFSILLANVITFYKWKYVTGLSKNTSVYFYRVNPVWCCSLLSFYVIIFGVFGFNYL